MSYAARQYEKVSSTDIPSRELEAMALAQVNRMLKAEEFSEKRRDALNKNQRLWSLLLHTINDQNLSPILRDDLIKVGTWSIRQSNIALNNNTPLSDLIEVNANIIEGLRHSVDAARATNE